VALLKTFFKTRLNLQFDQAGAQYIILPDRTFPLVPFFADNSTNKEINVSVSCKTGIYNLFVSQATREATPQIM
jgi:hypothetical protein